MSNCRLGHWFGLAGVAIGLLSLMPTSARSAVGSSEIPASPVATPVAMYTAPPCTAPKPVETSSSVRDITLVRGYRTLRYEQAPAVSRVFLRSCWQRGSSVAPALNYVIDVKTSGDGVQLAYQLSQPTTDMKNVEIDGESQIADDYLQLAVLSTKDFGELYEAFVNPKNKCATASRLLSVRDTKECTYSKYKPFGQVVPQKDGAEVDCAISRCWSGVLSVPWSVFTTDRIPDEFIVRIIRHFRLNRQNEFLSQRSDDFKVKVTYSETPGKAADTFHQQRYVSAASNLGFNPGVPPHRIAASAFVPLDRSELVSATLSDDSGPLLTQRDAILKSVVNAKRFKSLNCVACGTFQSDDTAAWDPIIVSKDFLGDDFAKLGTDSVPFSFDGAGYPIDSGYKAVLLDESIGLANMKGSTTNRGTAVDSVFRASHQFDVGRDILAVGFFDAIANRSDVPPITHATSSGFANLGRHSVNSEVSLGYKQFVPSDVSDVPNTSRVIDSNAAIVRYGTQYGRAAQRLDLAFAHEDKTGTQIALDQRDLPFLRISGGYRNLGQSYSPIDGEFDPIQGLHGFYGSLTLGDANTEHQGIPTFQVTAHRFSDVAEARDENVTFGLKAVLDKTAHLSLNSSVTRATLSQSQAARLLKGGARALSDGSGGLDYLPNNQISASLSYKNASYQLGAGYTEGDNVNCDKKVTVRPCYAYRQPSATGSLSWQVTKAVFIDGSIANQNDLFEKIGNARIGEVTTASHVVKKAAIGSYLGNSKCSSISFVAINRTGNVDSFSASPPQPGFTYGAFLDVSPDEFAIERRVKDFFPAVVVAFERQASLSPSGPAKPPSNSFLVRLRFGVPGTAFDDNVARRCADR